MDDAQGPEGDDRSRRASAVIFIVLGLLVATGLLFATLYRKPIPPPPNTLAGDAFLTDGHTLYQTRCASCHGAAGRGDGPIAKDAGPTPVGDLTDKDWKHGDAPEQVYRVIAQGVRGTSMSGWSGQYSKSELRAVAAYVYHLAGRPVPAALRTDEAGQR